MLNFRDLIGTIVKRCRHFPVDARHERKSELARQLRQLEADLQQRREGFPGKLLSWKMMGKNS